MPKMTKTNENPLQNENKWTFADIFKWFYLPLNKLLNLFSLYQVVDQKVEKAIYQEILEMGSLWIFFLAEKMMSNYLAQGYRIQKYVVITKKS